MFTIRYCSYIQKYAAFSSSLTSSLDIPCYRPPSLSVVVRSVIVCSAFSLSYLQYGVRYLHISSRDLVLLFSYCTRYPQLTGQSNAIRTRPDEVGHERAHTITVCVGSRRSLGPFGMRGCDEQSTEPSSTMLFQTILESGSYLTFCGNFCTEGLQQK